jgi:hypothetical protein
MVGLQGDFTDPPEHIPELVKRFEGGADVVVAERSAASLAATPVPVRRLRRAAPWVLRPFVSIPGVRDPFGALRLYRISVLRDLVKAAGADRPVVTAEGWGANVELLMNAAAFARRVETVELDPRYDLRPRHTRVRPLADTMTLFRFARTARARAFTPPPPAKPRGVPPAGPGATQPAQPQPGNSPAQGTPSSAAPASS